MFGSEYNRNRGKVKNKKKDECKINNKLCAQRNQQKEVGVLCGFVHLNDNIFGCSLCANVNVSEFVDCE